MKPLQSESACQRVKRAIANLLRWLAEPLT